ncbi:hypothetical protein TSUD_132340 [Trifolium subterraneum]|uniref:Endonuclease/exonuclease/phosphatase domain-containing protein n=1 Tax=Trifolium subterraneum TaxID=3900 RepID=A0A2Z6MQJ9_TRISU|nr:hypothetical protein TSUD_132340 [Trifolium subterraneum]
MSMLLAFLLNVRTYGCVLGDFNAIRSNDERKSNRSSAPSSVEFVDFNSFIDDNSLVDLPLCGRKFTWCKGDGLSMSRIDRFLLTEEWFLSLSNCLQAALPRTLSDHCPISLYIDSHNWGPRPIRLFKCWSEVPGYYDFVREKWKSFNVSGWSGFVLKEKLKQIKLALRDWHLNHTANIATKIQGTKLRMEELDLLAENRELDAMEEAEIRSLSVNLISFSKLQASMQWQKSRVNWLREGDANSKYFHGIMSSRRRHNSIVSLSVDGNTIDSVADVRKVVYDHFSNHFRKVSRGSVDIGGLNFKAISEMDREGLIKPFLLEEIKAAVWDCDSFKSPGPDGKVFSPKV